MSSVSAISATGSSPTSSLSVSQQIMALQSQMLFYSQYAQGNGTASTDYKTLEFDILTRNVSAAQTMLSQLERDSEAAAAATSQLVDNNNNTSTNYSSDGSTVGTQNSSGSYLNTLA
jgi:hypothetical protein